MIPAADQGTEAGRKRGIGLVFSNHRDETLLAETEDGSVVLQLNKERRRWDGGEPQVKYQFKTIV